MILRKKYGMLATTASLTLLLAACGNQEANTSSSEETAEDKASTVDSKFEKTVQHEGEAIEGGMLKVGIVADSAWTGIFSPTNYNMSTDATLMGPIAGTFLSQDSNYNLVGGEEYGAAADIEFDAEAKTATIKVKEGVKWHDGTPLTADDLVFAYEILAHKDYAGTRYSDDVKNVVGVEEYHNGEADKISGLELSDDKLTLIMHFKEFGPNMYAAGGGVWSSPEPRHYLQDVPVADLASHDKVRQNPMGFGPFKVKNITDSSVEYEANPDFFLGEPKVDGMTIERVPTSQAIQSLRNTQFDWMVGMPTTEYETFKEGIPGYTMLGTLGQSYDYIGFKMGKWNAEAEKVDYNPDAKMADKSLRQAMAYALDIEEVGNNVFGGLRHRATSHIVPNFTQFFNEELEGYPYDPEKANKLLDDAGYKLNEGDEYRTDKDGQPLEITFAARANSDVAQSVAEHYIQRWKEVGLKVTLLDGRLHETNAFYDRIQSDDPAIDIFEAGWGVGSDPTPDGLYGVNAQFNFPRYASEENTQYINNLKSQDALDADYRVDQFMKWQEFFIDEIPSVPTFWRTELLPVNKRVSAYSVETSPDVKSFGLHTIQLLAPEPISE